MVAGVDRLEHRVEVRRGPEFLGRGDQDDRVRPVEQALLKRPRPADLVARHDEGVGGAMPLLEEREQPFAHLVGRRGGFGARAIVVRPRVDHDHPDPTVGDRLAEGGGVERVNPVVDVVGDRPFQLRQRPHDRSPRDVGGSLRPEDGFKPGDSLQIADRRLQIESRLSNPRAISDPVVRRGSRESIGSAGQFAICNPAICNAGFRDESGAIIRAATDPPPSGKRPGTGGRPARGGRRRSVGRRL